MTSALNPCIYCYSTRIKTFLHGYGDICEGGAICQGCHATVAQEVGASATPDILVQIWNTAHNPQSYQAAVQKQYAHIYSAIIEQEYIIKKANSEIQRLYQSLPPALQAFEDDDRENLMTVEEFIEACESRCIVQGDGCGEWATRYGKSTTPVDIDCSEPPPAWATHVLWHNQ